MLRREDQVRLPLEGMQWRTVILVWSDEVVRTFFIVDFCDGVEVFEAFVWILRLEQWELVSSDVAAR